MQTIVQACMQRLRRGCATNVNLAGVSKIPLELASLDAFLNTVYVIVSELYADLATINEQSIIRTIHVY